ncbi:MAG: hypothetical protein H0U28_07785, partial [Nocardioidaceae bacterium]|nr:hypothetical protein [Nocardioidaceae bacterium]
MTSIVAAGGPTCLAENAWVCGEYLRTRQDLLIEATQQHLFITVVSVVIGLLLAFPLALLARRYRKTQGLVLGTVATFPRIVWCGNSPI